MTATADFLEKNQEVFTGLQGQVEALRAQPKNPEGYYQLVLSMEAYRDFIAGFLNTLPEGDRGRVDLFPAIFPLVEEATKLAVKAHEMGVIPENLAHVTGLLGNSTLFVAAWSAVVV